MAHPTHPADEAAALAEEQAVDHLKQALTFAESSFEVEPNNAPRSGIRLHVTPALTLPWSQGDVQGNLTNDGIIATVERVEQSLPYPGEGLLITLPSAQDVRALGRLVEAGLTEIQNGGLQLKRALLRASLLQSVAVHARKIDVEGFTPGDATTIFLGLGGSDLDVHSFDLDDANDHEAFAARFQAVLRLATGRELSVESQPVCRPCQPARGRSRIRLDLLDATDALALAAVLKKPAVPSAGKV